MEHKHKQAEVDLPLVPDEGGKSHKKQIHANQDVTMSRQALRVECNGKENNFGTRRKAEEKSEKKRQESVSPEPAPVCNNKDEGQEKADKNSRLLQKKQERKKKKKISLGEHLQTLINITKRG